MNKQMLGVYSVRERDKGRKAVWTRVGIAWPHTMGNGFNIELEALPSAGLLVNITQENSCERFVGTFCILLARQN